MVMDRASFLFRLQEADENATDQPACTGETCSYRHFPCFSFFVGMVHDDPNAREKLLRPPPAAHEG